jgi:sec-independent protein translocase protein TatC
MAKPAAQAAQAEPDREAELEEGRMPFMQHLGELRDRVRNAALSFVAAFLGCWYFSDRIFDWLKTPLFDIWLQHTGPGVPKAEDWGQPQMMATGVTQPFWVYMSVALWAGVFVASPFIFYQLWKFIAPGLYKRERKLGVSFGVLSGAFFILGALFCFRFALPALFRYMLHYNAPDMKFLLDIEKYLDLVRDSMLAFGLVFEMPLLIYFLALVGLVTHRGLWKFNRWFVVLAFIIGAILTPGPDVVSQFLMATPMIVLYNISILFAWRVTLRRERADAEQRAREDAQVTHKPKPTVESSDRDDVI